ncbi:hypothetical protein ZOSMA_175G00280 [Zostera marina]|uniref:Uncharacterized protein n=1 Tax=Zostera marina TaxID=29655 RepID=A0A0K9PS32_ZOSMR|nr:hypothetical protein ZOSMA_175G00280 [Zostera marina]
MFRDGLQFRAVRSITDTFGDDHNSELCLHKSVRRSQLGTLSTSLRFRVTKAIVIGVQIGCVLAYLYPDGLFYIDGKVLQTARNVRSSLVVDRSSCESVADVADLRSQIAALSEKNAGLKKQASELNLKLRALVESKDEAEKQLLVFSDKGPKAGPYGKVKSLQKNPTVVPNEYVNPILSKLLREISVEKEVMVTLANSNVKGTLSFFYENIKRIGIWNYLVVALDDQIESLC